MKITKSLLGGALLASLTLGAPVSSVASTVGLFLDDGQGNVVTVYDGGALDSNLTDGVVTYIGGVGAWIVNVSTAIGSEVLGLGNIDLNSVNVGVGTLTVGMTEFGLNDIGTATFLGDIGGTTNGSISWSMWIDAEDNAFGKGALIGSGSSMVSPFAASLSGSGDTSGSIGSYSWSMFVEVTHASQTDSTSFDFEGNVPAPASAALLGLGLLGMGLVRRRRSA